MISLKTYHKSKKMENAPKALLIAAAVLIVIMLVTFGIKIFNSSEGVTEQAQQVGNSISMATQSAITGIQIAGGDTNLENKTVPVISLSSNSEGSRSDAINIFVKLSNVSENNYPIKIEYYANENRVNSKTMESGIEHDVYTYIGNEYQTYNIKVVISDNLGNTVTATTTQTTQCFLAGTKVLTEEGMKNIEDIMLGEKVYSINLENNQRELKKVTKLYKGTTNETYEITVGKEIIKATPRHQFYIIDKGWIRAEELEIGDRMSCKDSNDMEITNIEYKYHEEPLPVYNLTIEANHNYLITKYELLVHNAASPTIK